MKTHAQWTGRLRQEEGKVEELRKSLQEKSESEQRRLAAKVKRENEALLTIIGSLVAESKLGKKKK